MTSRYQRAPLREVGSTVYMPPLRSSSLSTTQRKNTGDRFIPDRSSMDFDLGHFQLTESRKENSAEFFPAKEAYRKLLAGTLLNNRTRILAFNSKPCPSSDGFLSESDAALCSSRQVIRWAKPPRYISQTAEEGSLLLPGLIDDYCLNLLDWGRKDALLIALGNEVYMWNVKEQRGGKLVTVDERIGPVTSVSWLPSGYNFAIGLNNSHIQLWDLINLRLFRTLSEVHQSRVGSMAWNNKILTTGGMDGNIVNNDIRSPSPVIQTYRGHTQEICGLKWSGSGQQLASGGNDNLLNIWDLSMSSSDPHRNQNRNQNQWAHRFEDHTAAVRALAWCPFQSNLLASGGGGTDRCIKFWNTHTGECLNSVNTGSQVCSLLWNKNERELLSSHGSSQNQLTLWKYPSMVKMAELTGHSSRPLYMAQSPDGSTVASAAGGDSQSLLFWNVFGTPGVHKPAAKVASAVPFSSYNHIRPMG